MKIILLIFSLFLIISCSVNQGPEKETEVIVKDKVNEIDGFKDYTFSSKEIIYKENTEFNYETETTCIGMTQIDSLEYNVFTEFRKIQLANSIRGRSTLFFINESLNDTLEYDGEMPDRLPLDIYKDYFVFKREEDSNYLFLKLVMVIKDVICFDGLECFNSNRVYD